MTQYDNVSMSQYDNISMTQYDNISMSQYKNVTKPVKNPTVCACYSSWSFGCKEVLMLMMRNMVMMLDQHCWWLWWWWWCCCCWWLWWWCRWCRWRWPGQGCEGRSNIEGGGRESRGWYELGGAWGRPMIMYCPQNNHNYCPQNYYHHNYCHHDYYHQWRSVRWHELGGAG